MKKLIYLSNFIKKLGLKEEASAIYKMSMALPEGTSIQEESIGGSLGTPGGINPQFVKKNLDLKEIFAKHYDPAFFKTFNYIHYFRGSDSSAEDYVRHYGPGSGGNPMEISVVGAPMPVCQLKNKTQSSIGGNGSFAFRLEGEPTSAFYYDATSSYYEQMNAPDWLKTLEESGVNPEEYNPKIINITRGRLDSFFFDRESYDEVASSSHQSDYHEIFLKNSKVKEVLIDETLDKDEVRNFFEAVDPYWTGHGNFKKIDVIFCSGDSQISGFSAREKIVKWIDSYFNTDYRNKVTLDSEKFINMFASSSSYESEEEMSHEERIMKDIERKRKGMDILEEGLYNGAELKEIFSSLYHLLPYNRDRESDISKFMSEYIDSFRYQKTIYGLEELWGKVLINDYDNKISYNYLPREIDLSITKDKKNIFRFTPVEEITKPIFEKIKEDIQRDLKVPSKTNNAVDLYISLLEFLSDTGIYCYEKNIQNNGFNYYLTMIRETEEITRSIVNNNQTKETLIENNDASFIVRIYELVKYSPEILRMIVEAYESRQEYRKEVDDAISEAEKYMSQRQEYLSGNKGNN